MDSETSGAMTAYQSSRRMVLGALIFLIGILLVFSGSLQSENVHEEIEAFGLAVILIGIGGRLWCTLYIGGRKSAELVSSGPYSMMRNPLYFFSTVAAVGIGAQTGSLTIAFVIGMLCALAFHVVALREERYLKANLGASYADYLERVPRFFPDPRLYRDEKAVTFKPRLLRQTLLDGLVFLVSIPFFELVEGGQHMGWIPVFFWVY